MKGFVTLMSVLIIGVVGTAIAVFLILMGTDAYRTSFDLEQSFQAKALADACAEKALDAIRQDINYTGSETVSFDKGNCEILAIINPGTQSPTVRSKGTVGSAIRKAQISTQQITPQIKIQSWGEVADFQ